MREIPGPQIAGALGKLHDHVRLALVESEKQCDLRMRPTIRFLHSLGNFGLGQTYDRSQSKWS